MKSRSMTFLWQLTKDWKPEWGGAYYWNHAYYENAYQHASYNTLIMWSVTSQSVHAVTPVTRKAKGKRLTFGGWYSSKLEVDSKTGQLYDIHNDYIEEWYATKESRLKLTVDECKAIISIDIDSDEYQDISEERRLLISQLQDNVLYDGFGPYEETHIYTLGSVEEDIDDGEDHVNSISNEDEEDGGMIDPDVTPSPICDIDPEPLLVSLLDK